jgi:hypothetical protein
MPAWLIPVLTIGTALFTAGVTWGVFSYRQSRGESDQSNTVKDLKECVTKLQGVVTEVEVMKVAQARFDRQSEAQENRLTAVEIAVAKLQPRRRK